ncbi:MAG: hypothetical protein CMA48_00480 [Euryarchaeota archaeon]|nr:hypothetical protein [Euryarchaeota archaeon]|tara:strand:+ start:1696 stop:2646 length:951 start_codon:yes stop_codon:yes gene_type:complete
MIKTLIAVPIFNEEGSIEDCLDSLLEVTRDSKNYNYEIACFNDGSTDRTSKILDKYVGQVKIIQSRINYGLSEVFNSIMFYAKENTFDYLVVFDADNQYPYQDIPEMLNTSIEERSDIHIGARDFNKLEHFTRIKKILQKIGSKFISYIIGKKIHDATSGFRVYSSRAIEALFSTNSFTYTLETLFQSNPFKLKVTSSIISDSFETRESRLFKNNSEYLKKSFFVILKSILLYKNSFLNKIMFLSFVPGVYLLSRFFIPYFSEGTNPGNVQSLVVGTSYLIILILFIIIFYIFSNNYQTKSLFLKLNYKAKHLPSK